MARIIRIANKMWVIFTEKKKIWPKECSNEFAFNSFPSIVKVSFKTHTLSLCKANKIMQVNSNIYFLK